MKKECALYVLCIMSFVPACLVGSDYRSAHSAVGQNASPASSEKQVVRTCTLPKGSILTVYSDGSSETKYTDGRVVKHPKMFK